MDSSRPEHTVDAALSATGYAVLDRKGVETLVGQPLPIDAWSRLWNALPEDQYLRDGGRYRRRRYGCFIAEHQTLERTSRQLHWQPVEYNALHGGLERWFEPLEPRLVDDPAWSALLLALAARADALRSKEKPERWFIEAHQFRIDTTDGIGRPTPEGAHRDGVDLVAVMVVARVGVRGGETRVFDARSPSGLRFTIEEPGTTVLLDDERVIHESTPIQPTGPTPGYRDTLVITVRAGGFQG
ncbi:MAG: 2OG-Fe dioxygenase family protein [Myxococcales bacterium]|nr:2OG-Fe dioxygenase family protein [Myxococcales bacterium]